MLLLSDIHGEFEALAQLARSGETLVILGDFINLIDYRTGAGLISDVLGDEFGRQVSERRSMSDYAGMGELWAERIAGRVDEVTAAMTDGVIGQYQACRKALEGARGYVTYGNVDRPELLAAHLPAGMEFVDAQTVEIDGLRFGFVGGGIVTPVGASGEVSEVQMADKLARLGPVDVLCSHLPPAVPSLHRDVITGRLERSSLPILDYLREYRPRLHFFGDVHQPQASTWRVGPTVCRNVGYFRATRRPIRFDPKHWTIS